MLEELLGNTTRSALLRLFWEDGFEGATTEIQKELGSGYGVVHGEVKRLLGAGMLTQRRDGRRVVYAANLRYPHAKTLRDVLGATALVEDPRQPKLYRELKTRGAPLLAEAYSRPRRAEVLFVEAVEVSRRDPTLLRALPAWIDSLGASFSLDDVVTLAGQSPEKHAVGFVLALIAEVLGRSELLEYAEKLRDGRRVRDERYVVAGRRTKRWEERVAKARPKVAKEWQFLLDAPVSDFRELVLENRAA
ncbi:MAG: winged helix-turn-helix domain-containing protein [Myxococcota bacterium]